MEALVLDGKRYVKASRAARLAGYTSDYVGQLCRSGKISAKLVGRSWYVDEEELRAYKSETKRTSRQKAREQVRETVRHIGISEGDEPPHRARHGTHFERRIHQKQVAYTDDPAELIPPVRKIAVDSEVPEQTSAKEQETEEEAPYELENEGKKVVMSGELTLEDASEDAVDADTVLLTPKIIKQKREQRDTGTKPGKARKKRPDGAERPVGVKTGERTPLKDSKAENSGTERGTEAVVELTVVAAGDEARTEAASRIPYGTAMLIVSVLVSSAAVLLSSVWVYSAGDGSEQAHTIESRYTVESMETISDMYFK